jgi:hypothetical protein
MNVDYQDSLATLRVTWEAAKSRLFDLHVRDACVTLGDRDLALYLLIELDTAIERVVSAPPPSAVVYPFRAKTRCTPL